MAMLNPVAFLLFSAEIIVAPPRLPTVATMERLALPMSAGSLSLTVLPFEKRLELRTKGEGRALHARIAATGSRLCPESTVERNVVTLTCRSRRLDGAVVEDKGRTYLEIYELRGVPWKGEENRINIFYGPIAFKVDDACPGSSPLSRGECAFQAGQYATAAVEFRRALTSDGKRVAAIRLGDLSIINQDPIAAAGWYHAAGRAGAFGRMAAGRLCELSGSCFEKSRRIMLEANLLPEPLHTEMLLRGARVAAYLDEIPRAMEDMRRAIETTRGGCDGSTAMFCRRLLLKVFQQPGKDGVVEALETYLALPNRHDGPLALTLVHAAVDKVAKMGAPVFAGNLLAASGQIMETQRKPVSEDLLLKNAELYLAGLDRTRARVVVEFAETRLGRAKLVGPRWNAVLAEVQEGAPDPLAEARVNVVAGEVTRDLTTAYTSLARANSLLVEAAAVKEEIGKPAQPAKEKTP
jgi:hypothetical protein